MKCLRLLHVNLRVERLQEAKGRVAAAGAPVEQRDPRRFWTRDPSGNRIELVARA